MRTNIMFISQLRIPSRFPRTTLRRIAGVIFRGWSPVLWCGGLHGSALTPDMEVQWLLCLVASGQQRPDFDQHPWRTRRNGQRTRFLTFIPLREWKSPLLPFCPSSWLLCLSPLSFPSDPLGFNWILMVALLVSVAQPILIFFSPSWFSISAVGEDTDSCD